MEIALLLSGVVLGFFLGLFFSRTRKTGGVSPEELSAGYVSRDLADALRLEKEKLETERELKEELVVRLNTELAGAKESQRMQLERMREIQAEQAEFKQRFEAEFKVLAESILKEQSKTFTQQNREQLETVLNPMREKLKDFEEKVQKSYETEQKERISLKTEVTHLMKLNERLSEEANNLVKALKGDVKAQGNWGEIILERLLERSGLQKDREYFVQESVTTEDGRRLQPDVVIHLPDQKRIVVDSKVSLVAYERYTSADTDEKREQALKLHIQSLRAHIKGLSEKNYQNLYGVDQLDFVLLFVPIEPAFGLATQNDAQLFNDAFDRNIVLVTNSTLLATLRTIASIWKQEYQNRNALKIAEEGGKLYDKFVSFTDDLIRLGQQFHTAQGTYQEAMKKLSDGTGNLVRRAEIMKELGVKANKDFNSKLLERALDAPDEND